MTVELAVEPGRTSPEAGWAWPVVALAEPVLLVVLWTSLEVELVSAQVVPLAFRQVLLVQGQQMAPVWLPVQQIWLDVALAELVSAQVVPLASLQVSLERAQQPPVDYDSAERSRQLVAAPEQGELESLARLVSRRQLA